MPATAYLDFPESISITSNIIIRAVELGPLVLSGMLLSNQLEYNANLIVNDVFPIYYSDCSLRSLNFSHSIIVFRAESL